eukprot:jgi/Ulvmu1/3623/UM017_0035.1
MDLLVKPARVKRGKLASLLEPPDDHGAFAAATKIVATIGRATREESVLHKMFEAGMTAARFDLSFGDLLYHSQSLELVHEAATKANRLCSMILDLGDKNCHVVQPTRVDENGWDQCTQRIRIERGQTVKLTTSGDLFISQDAEREVVLPVSQPQLLACMQTGDEVSIGRYLAMDQEDRKATLAVLAVTPCGVVCEARESMDVMGHLIVAHVPKQASSISGHTSQGRTLLLEDDIAAMDAFHSRGMLDFLVVGDICSPQDVMTVRQHLFSIGASDTKLLLKLKTAVMVENFSLLSGLIDGIVLARGWLGVHTPPEHMAPLQKRLLRHCNINGKLALVTRIVDSMQDAPRPTRAEATDIANSVLDGADGFVLGSQTTRGTNPVKVVETVSRICREAERAFDYSSHLERIMTIMAQQKTLLGSFTEPKTKDAPSDETASADIGCRLPGAFVGKAETPREPPHSLTDPSAALPAMAPAVVNVGDGPGGPSRRQSFSDFMERPSGLANVMSTGCLSTATSLDARDASATGSESTMHAGTRRSPADGGMAAGQGQSTDGAHSVDGGTDSAKGQQTRRLSPTCGHGRPPSPPHAGAVPARPGMNSQSSKAAPLKRDLVHERLSRSFNATAAGRPFHPVASWGTLSIPITSTASSPHASFTNLSGFEEAAAAAAAAIGRTATPPLRTLTPRRAMHAMGGQTLQPFGHTPSEAVGGLMTNAQVLAASAVNLASSCGAQLILVVTDSGHTAAAVAKFRPRMPVISLVVPRVVKTGLAWSVKGNVIARQCNLLHGVTSILGAEGAHPKGILAQGLQHALDSGLASSNDLAVVITGVGGRFSASTVQQMRIKHVLSPSRQELVGVLA